MQELEEWLFESRPARYVQLATAAAQQGEEKLQHWHTLGAQAAARLGVEQVVIDVRVRADASRQEFIDAIDGAGVIYLSGGNPKHLARTLIDTPVWQAIHRAWRTGASLAGCSAGAMALCGYIPDVLHLKRGGQSGLGVVPTLRALPHFDNYAKWIPDMVMRPLLGDDVTIVGIDELTSLRAEPPQDLSERWKFRGVGHGSCWRIEHDRRYRINSPIHLPVALD